MFMHGQAAFQEQGKLQIVEYPKTFLGNTSSEYSTNVKAIGRTPLVPLQFPVVLR
jgi:hypothetical protein